MARIMIVDDALFMRVQLKKILRTGGHDIVAEAENGNVAVLLYKELMPDIVLMDITMPEKDGLAALTDIKADDPNAKIVMCTAVGQETKVREALAGGASDYIVKPVNPQKLLDVVDRLC